MDAFETSDLLARREQSGHAYLEVLRVADLSAGVYHLAAGEPDPQFPHTEDEIYVVIRGHATIRVGAEDRPVREGTVVYVAAGAPHRFHSIREDLDILVVFAPAEGSRGPSR